METMCMEATGNSYRPTANFTLRSASLDCFMYIYEQSKSIS